MNKKDELIPLEDFFRNPDKVLYKLSPDGEYFSFLAPYDGFMNIHVQKIGDNEEVIRLTEEKRNIYNYFWLNNNRIGYLQDKNGDEKHHLYAVDIDKSNLVDLTPLDDIRVQIINLLKNNDKHILIGLNKRIPSIYDVYKLDVNTGDLELLIESPGSVTDWLCDSDEKVRIGLFTDNTQKGILYRSSESENFEEIVRINYNETLTPLLFTPDNQNIYVASNLDRDKTAIYEYNPMKKEFVGLIYENDEVDVSEIISSYKDNNILGVKIDSAKTEYLFFDEKRKNLQDKFEKKFPDHIVGIEDTSKDEKKLLVRVYDEKSYGSYYFYDLENDEFNKIADITPWIDESKMAETKPVKYSARDGLTINGYLTLPKTEKTTNFPVVVIPHGGPWMRDYWRYDSRTQFFANRGYAVLSMNYRGSTSYGKKFEEAGFKNWGRKMQDDVSDGVNWLIEENIADPKRVGIFGGSYAGYVVLAGLTFTPDLFACGVDGYGISNLISLLYSFPPQWEHRKQVFYMKIGDPVKDEEMLKSVSPLFHIDKIKSPLFVAHGRHDPRVKIEESNQIVEKLKNNNVEVEYLVFEDEGHGFRNEKNILKFMKESEKFLEKVFEIIVK